MKTELSKYIESNIKAIEDPKFRGDAIPTWKGNNEFIYNNLMAEDIIGFMGKDKNKVIKKAYLVLRDGEVIKAYKDKASALNNMEGGNKLQTIKFQGL